MIQLGVLSGSSAGVRKDFKKFPINVGRSATSALSLSDPGVFEEHFKIDFTSDGFVLSPGAEAVTTVNGERSERAILRNGDVIGAGLAKIQFWLGAMEQRGLKSRELFAWVLVLSAVAAQVYLLVRLLEIAR